MDIRRVTLYEYKVILTAEENISFGVLSGYYACCKEEILEKAFRRGMSELIKDVEKKET